MIYLIIIAFIVYSGLIVLGIYWFIARMLANRGRVLRSIGGFESTILRNKTAILIVLSIISALLIIFPIYVFKVAPPIQQRGDPGAIFGGQALALFLGLFTIPPGISGFFLCILISFIQVEDSKKDFL